MAQNRLAAEKSPYLLQHAHNPVDWYAWRPEALERAKKEDRPILLSIGYAACHWCHVMERESFENEEIAKAMNARFINIKVDREERPDLDHIYQLVVQLMGRSGGWPLTVFLTPDQRPFFAGTYFPPADRFGMPGFPKILAAVAEAYQQRRADVELQAQELTQAIGRVHRLPSEGSAELGPDLLRRASRKLMARFDPQNGGFGSRPKFPNTMVLEVLLRRGVLEKDEVESNSARLALDRMRAGGIWDHLRGGFHRYSTDDRWLVPHFEKMLYDNALLLHLYIEAFRAFGEEAYAGTAREIVGYLFAEMRDPSGGFYASQDADSEGVEGKFFVWTGADLEAAIGGDTKAVNVARSYFGVTDEGNFEGSRATVLSEARPLDRVAADLRLTLGEAREALDRAKAKMLSLREKRPRPSRDEKILASWNGLLISALADAGRALGEPEWTARAAEAFAVIEKKLLHAGLVRRYLKDGAAAASFGFLDDQGYVGNAALDLYETTHDPHYVEVARAIADATLEQFWDAAEGGFFFTPAHGDPLIARTKDVFDQAVPSGASMASLLLLRLGALADEKYLASAEKHLGALAAAASENAFAMGQTTLVLDLLVRGSIDVVIVGDPSNARTHELADAVFRTYLPNRNLVVVDPNRPETALVAKLLAEGKTAKEGEPVAYVCRGRTCSAPLTSATALIEALSAS